MLINLEMLNKIKLDMAWSAGRARSWGATQSDRGEPRGPPEEKAIPPADTGHVHLQGAAAGVVPGAGSGWH